MIVEHPFGTIKRGLGFTYFLTRGIENVRTENRMHMLTYNIKRVLNIFSVPDLTCKLKEIRGKMQGNQGDNSVVILSLLRFLPMFKLYKGNPAKFANI